MGAWKTPHQEWYYPDRLILETDIDEYLDKRNSSEEFESQLLAAFDEVTDTSNEDIDGYESLSISIFKKIDGLVGTSELFGYVSEDFEVILKTLHKGISNDFINDMLYTYLVEQLPNATWHGFSANIAAMA